MRLIGKQSGQALHMHPSHHHLQYGKVGEPGKFQHVTNITIGDEAHQPSCFCFPQCDFGKTSVVKRSSQRQWPQFSGMVSV